MKRFLQLSLFLISLQVGHVLQIGLVGAYAYGPSPLSARYSAYIETPKASVSGICILAETGDTVRGCFFNEFGITALSFLYIPSRDKVTLKSVMPALDKWYIRRVLRRDLRRLLHRLQQGDGTYQNSRYHINYSLTPLDDEIPR